MWLLVITPFNHPEAYAINTSFINCKRKNKDELTLIAGEHKAKM